MKMWIVKHSIFGPSCINGLERYELRTLPLFSICLVNFSVMFRVVTFRVSHRRREMYCGHPRLRVCVSVCMSVAARPHYCTDPDVTWGSGRGCPLVVHYWADLQSGYGLRCYGNITRTRNVSEYMLVLAICLVLKLYSTGS